MYTSFGLVALASLFLPSSLPEGPAWRLSYSLARQEGQRGGKPLAVVVGSGRQGFDSLSHFNAIPFGGSELFVPMASKWHPGAVAYGIVAFYLLIAVEITSLLRHRIPASVWRSVHYGGFVVFLLGSVLVFLRARETEDAAGGAVIRPRLAAASLILTTRLRLSPSILLKRPL